jgi:3-methyladenine DNA glycosylase AlkD
LAEQLLDDQEDLMHKAAGWMLREVGKRVSLTDLRGFLKKQAPRMPRTMLRYAIERLSEAERQKWMAAQFA